MSICSTCVHLYIYVCTLFNLPPKDTYKGARGGVLRTQMCVSECAHEIERSFGLCDEGVYVCWCVGS